MQADGDRAGLEECPFGTDNERAGGAIPHLPCSRDGFHSEPQRLWDALSLPPGDKRDTHAGFDDKVVTASALLQ